MADILLFPNISFDESDVGPRPLVSAAGNRIGVVGEFLRGPYNKFLLIDTPETLTKVLGKTTHNGSVAIQTAMDQGARDFGVMRVMGSGANAAAFLRCSLLSGSTATGTGSLVLMATGVKVPVVGNSVTTKEQVAQLVAAAINASRIAKLSAQVTGSTVNLSSSLAEADALPMMFRLVDRDNLMATVADSGILIKDAQGNVIQPDALFRLAGGTTQLTFDYDQTALAATLEIANSTGTPADGDNLTVQIGAVNKTVSILNSSSVTLDLTTPPAAGEIVSVTIGGVSQTHTVVGGDTVAAIFTDLVSKFTAAAPAFLGYLDLAVTNSKMVISSEANKAFAPVAITTSVTPVGGNAVVGIFAPVGGTVNPVITTPAGIAANLAFQFASHPLVNVVASGDTLVVRPKATLAASVALGAVGTNGISGDWDLAQLAAPTGVNKTTVIHLLMGGEAQVTQGVSTTQSIISELSKSLNSRNLAVTADVLSSLSEMKLTSRFDGGLGNNTLYGVFQLANGALTAFDAQLKLEHRPAVVGVVYADAANGQMQAFGGGVDGPVKGVYTFRRRKFVRAKAEGTLSFANSQVTLTLTAGEVGINSVDKISLVGKTVVCSVGTAAQGQPAKNYIIAKEDGTLKAYPTADTNEVIIGEYSVVGAQAANNKGTFTAAQAANGDVLRIEAASEGNWSKDLKVTVLSESVDLLKVVATYKTLTDENYNSETFEFKLSEKGVLDGGQPYQMVAATKNSNLINIYYVGGNEEGKSVELLSETQPLLGGDNGPPVSVQDYVNILEKMSLNPVNLLIAPGQTHPTVRDRLIRQAEASDEISGLRIAVLSADRAMGPQAAKQLTNGLDSKYAVMVGGYCTYTGRNDLAPLSVPPDGFYAGHLAVTPVEVSPAARTSSPSFKGISEVDTVPGTTAYNEYTKARCEMIIADQVTKVFHCLNGRSLAVDTAWNWISLRRIYNYIRSNAFASLQFAKSEPNTPQLRRSVADTVDNLLFAMFSKQQIAGYQPTKADDENNPSNMVAQGLLKVDVFFTPVYPADFIGVGLHRTMAVSLTVQTGA